MENYFDSYDEMQRILTTAPRVEAIRPEKPIELGLFERNKNTINELFAQGARDAEEYMHTSGLIEKIRE